MPHATVLEPLQSAEHLKDGLERELAGVIQFRAVLDCSLQSIVHGQQQSAVFSGGEDDVVIDVGVVSDGVEVGFVQEQDGAGPVGEPDLTRLRGVAVVDVVTEHPAGLNGIGV